jgi:DNA-binding GntR family transcriptional regulator
MKQTLYIQLAQYLKDAIASRKYPVGTLLPTELELAEIYSASRHSIRAAIAELQAIGLVSRKKGIGTRVEAISPKSSYKQTIGSIEDLVAFSESSQRTFISSENVSGNKKISDELKYKNRRNWIKLTYLRYSDSDVNIPLSITKNYIDAKFKNIVNLVKKNPRSLISNLIESEYGTSITEIKQEISGVVLNKEQAKILRSKENFPGLRIRRSYFDSSNEIFEITITTYPADRYTVDTKLRRDTSVT